MFIRIKTSSNGIHKKVQLVESIRKGDTVRQKIVRHIGTATDERELEQLKNLAQYVKAKIEEERKPGLFPPEEMAELTLANTKSIAKTDKVHVEDLREVGRHVVGIHDVYGEVYKDLGLDRVIANPARNKQSSEYLRHVVMARIANPCSKRKSVAILSEEFGISLKLEKVYRMLDKINDKSVEYLQKSTCEGVQKVLALHQEAVDVLFYDATTLYFESFKEDELKQNGYSKDMKFNQPQVLLAVFVTSHGLPMGYEVFPGATYEGHTLIGALEKLKIRFEIRNIIFVADSGLLNKDNLEALDEAGYSYIVGARIKNTSEDCQKKILEKPRYQTLDEELSYQTIDLEDGKRMLVSYSAKRARKDAHDRKNALEKLRAKLSKSKDPASLISNFGYKKFLQIEGKAKVVIDDDKLEQAARWDGLHGVITNAKHMAPRDILSHYKGLWQIEETFRVSKHDLKIRPIFHWTPSRIRAHIAICYMALSCIRHLEYRIKKHYQKLSPQVIRENLLSVQISLLAHKHEKKTYVMPSTTKEHAKAIYRVMALKLSRNPYLVA